MPSKAYKTFKYNLVDVENLQKAHEALSPIGKGKRSLGHITRGAVVNLCACWEQYAEEIVCEAVGHISKKADNPNDLPKQVQKVLSRKVKAAKHELKPLELAGEGWKKLYEVYAENDTAQMHSPKSEKIQELMVDYLGIESKVWDAWRFEKDELDKFVKLRNSIAHKGRAMEKYVKFRQVSNLIQQVHLTVIDTDNFVSSHLRGHLGDAPWRQKRHNGPPPPPHS